jgi:hypothetical protein
MSLQIHPLPPLETRLMHHPDLRRQYTTPCLVLFDKSDSGNEISNKFGVAYETSILVSVLKNSKLKTPKELGHLRSLENYVVLINR